MMAEPGFCCRYNMETITSLFGAEEVETPVKGIKDRAFNPLSKTYLTPNIKKFKATEDIPQALEIEAVRGNDDERSESEVFRRSSLLLHLPPKTSDEKEKVIPPILNSMRIGSLPDVGELKPVDRLEGIAPAKSRRASTPLETTRTTERDDSVAITGGDLTLTQEEAGEMEEGGMSEASSVVFAPSRIHKRTRGVLSNSAASVSATGDEGSMAAEERPKKKKRGRPKTTNIIVARTEREKKQLQEREEWERRRMEDPNLIIPPAQNLPGLEEITEEMENQPTPDLTSELLQVVRTLEKVATTSRNLNGVYVRAFRLAALKVHAGTNLLARRLHEQAGGNTDEPLADFRRRNRALQLEKERLEQEAEQAVQTRRELKKTRRELEDMRRENKDLKARCVRGESSSTSPPPPPLLHLSIPSPAPGGPRSPPAKSGSRSTPPPPPGGAEREFEPSYFLLQ